ncbi:hypothetical protein AJ79_01543 [Helicocarpus griseus UAMH5409]|uniref:Uncharacterized protein n=1 Tax=Helicocarpus griseus UAMH5409 TaxID=1447875 RepID=A0A2B7Y6M1_9EURO|nr:hypothetical protein AJ79_01543 [Helicocarpus griseus UAMH5409]
MRSHNGSSVRKELELSNLRLAMDFKEKAEPSTSIPRHISLSPQQNIPVLSGQLTLEEARQSVRIDRAGAEHQNGFAN